MTREEIIEILTVMKGAWMMVNDTPKDREAAAFGVKALDAAISALRGPTREQVEKMKGEWEPFGGGYFSRKKCSRCGWDGQDHIKFYSWCPDCGAPMTDKAVDMTMKRLEEMQPESQRLL